MEPSTLEGAVSAKDSGASERKHTPLVVRRTDAWAKLNAALMDIDAEV